MLHYKTYELDNPEAPWVVFVHGAGGSSSIWFLQIKEFIRHFNVLLVDLRGHGKSKGMLFPRINIITTLRILPVIFLKYLIL